jgi:hypothetical protein
MTSALNLTTTRRNPICVMASKIVRVATLFTVIVLSGLVLVSAEEYFDPEHQLDAAQIFVLPE